MTPTRVEWNRVKNFNLKFINIISVIATRDAYGNVFFASHLGHMCVINLFLVTQNDIIYVLIHLLLNLFQGEEK